MTNAACKSEIVTYMFLDIAPYLLAEGEVLRQRPLDDIIKALQEHRYSCEEVEQKNTTGIKKCI